MTDAVTESLAARAQFTRLELPDADHFLGLRFRDHVSIRAKLREVVRERTRPYHEHVFAADRFDCAAEG